MSPLIKVRSVSREVTAGQAIVERANQGSRLRGNSRVYNYSQCRLVAMCMCLYPIHHCKRQQLILFGCWTIFNTPMTLTWQAVLCWYKCVRCRTIVAVCENCTRYTGYTHTHTNIVGKLVAGLPATKHVFTSYRQSIREILLRANRIKYMKEDFN